MADIFKSYTKKKMIKNEEIPKLSNDASRSSIIELFPWILKFRQMCKCIYTYKSMASLTELMQFYVRNVSASVNECYTKPLRAEKLKDFISETLVLFLYIYRELSEDQNRFIYLSNMSDLLALYIDMELKASRKRIEDRDKICARLTSCLYVYLDHSVEHLLDTLMKIQFMCQSYHDILDPVITKIMKNIPAHPETSIMYLRYFLIYCLWRKINDDVAVRNQITATALASLGPLPSTFSPSILGDVLPKVPKNQQNSTETLLQHKFDIKKHCEIFLQYCRKSNGSVCQKDGPAPLTDSSSSINSKMPEDSAVKHIEHVDNVNSVISDKTKQNESISMLKSLKFHNLEEKTSFKCLGSFSNNISTKQINPNLIKSNKNCSQRKCKKSNEIVIIDLTSDVVLEKCIKKRKLRKLPWLEEAKKRIDMKIVKSSQKMKKKKKHNQENGDRIQNPLNMLRSYHTKDTLQPSNCVEKVVSRNDSNTCQSVGVKSNENNIEINVELVNCTENTRKLNGTEVNIKEVNVKVSPGTVAPVLTKIFSSKKQISKISDIVISNNYLNNGDVSNVQSDEKENDRFNKQTVIKRLIETDIFPESEACEKVESFKKICDLETERPGVNNTAGCNQYYLKGDPVKSNRSKFNVISDEMTEKVTLSINEEHDQDISSDETLRNVCSSETTGYTNNIVNSEIKQKELVATQSYDTKGTTVTKAAETFEIKDTQQLSRENSVTEEKFESQTELKSLKSANTMDESKKERYCAQIELESYNYDEADNDVTGDKSSIANSRESIFESYSINKKDISNTINATCPSENSCKNFNKSIDKKDVPEEMSRSSSEVTSKGECDNSYKVTDQVNVRNSTDNKYNIVQDSELQDSIDGLSLLASVSQHVPHLKPESEVKCEQIKVKDYASLKYTCYNQITDDETDTNDSSNTVSQLLENPSSEIINRIVGIYPEDALNKVLHVEVASNDTDDNKLCKIASNSEAEVNYETEMLTNNFAPTESNTQTVKENTNVILNGETVVLLQKSPNSNLYIINKAVENSKDHINDEDGGKSKEKSWVSSSEECGQFEAVASLDHASYNLELTLYNKELPYQENKFSSVARGKGIKVEPEDGNFSDSKSYSAKVSLSTEMLPVNSQMYQDVNAMSKSIDKRKSSNLAYRQNIKQEYSNISNHIPSNCVIPGCNRIHSHSHDVDAQHPLHIPATHPTTLPQIYGNYPGNADLCVPYHKHCTSVSCNLQINNATSLCSHSKSSSPCGRSRCSCLNCTYDIVTHCRQCIHPSADTRVSCIESTPYFLPAQSPVQSPTVQEHERTKSETVIGKRYDDQLLCKIEKSLLQSNTLEKLEVQCDSKKVFRKEADNKLPLKKRLKVHAMAYEEVPIKAERMDNYPAVPMMSIAALEASESSQKRSVLKSEYQLFPTSKEDPRDGYHCDSGLARRSYLKDSATRQNLTKENTRKIERQFRSANDQPDSTLCQESCLQRTVKTKVEGKEMNLPDITSLKRFEMESMGEDGTYKKAKKTPLRQTRSSKRNVPKVNYSYTDVDPEWNPSGESKRKRKKTSR
ncbi:uncharacterized protein LOC114873912 isoform X3 [Osmia bicornis bicornis]|uniref:uncharacterized protein LOC114873912 isoform X3 n=1 Tax=Osmia bicornis bicornis TaxID=1437191 RepID=UPI001EAE9078|nr:uncharacterized protein LOC114873912 isoform X3 [Osmia bicornis bicornis]